MSVMDSEVARVREDNLQGSYLEQQMGMSSCVIEVGDPAETNNVVHHSAQRRIVVVVVVVSW